MATAARFWIDGSLQSAGPGARFKKGTIRLAMLSVGPGEAIFLEAGRTAALVDGGATNAPENETLATELGDWIKKRDLRLKMFIASHPHVDHLNGLPPLLRSLPKSRFAAGATFYHNGEGTSKKFIQRLLNQVRGLPWLQVAVPVTPLPATLGPRTSVVLFMDGSTRHGEAYKSVLALVQHDQARFLLTGDVYADYEAKLVQSNLPLLPADVLKVTHHGSKGGTSALFLNAVRPKIAVASTARRPDGSVDPSHNVDGPTAKRLKNINARLFQTAVAGTIVVTTDGVRQPRGILFEVTTDH